MDRHFLDTWKNTIAPDDTLWNLGDFSWYANKAWLTELLSGLPGKKILLLGNHDRGHKPSWWRDVGFDEVHEYPIIVNEFFILSHEPVYVGPQMPYVNIHGHTHSESSSNPQKVNISVEQIGYKPILLQELFDRFKDERPEEKK